MADILDQEARSAHMRLIRQKDTTPELVVRRVAHAAGLRFRLHRRDLPGTPDLVFPRHRIAVFVHGCFWHRHEGCRKATMPKTRTEFWSEKFNRNRERDARNVAELEALGWRVGVVWECQTRDPAEVEIALARTFGDDVVDAAAPRAKSFRRLPSPLRTALLDADK